MPRSRRRENMKTILMLATAAALCAGPALAEPAAKATAKGEWTGYITDTHCANKGAGKEHTADCVEKCMKKGSKAQILNEADNKLYDLDSFEKVKTLVGQKVAIKGTLDEKTNTIKVASAAKAAEKNP